MNMDDSTPPAPSDEFGDRDIIEAQVLGAAHWIKRLISDLDTYGATAAIYYSDIVIEVLLEDFDVSPVVVSRSDITAIVDELDELRAKASTARGDGKRRPISGARRIQVFERDAYRCVVCQSWQDLTIDHIHPVARGGTNDIDNLQTMCRSCNSSKGARV